MTPVEAREIVYQAVPYTGMGPAFDFIHATNDVLTERGVKLPLDGQATTTPATRASEGRAIQERIVGRDLIGVITVLLPFIGYPRTRTASPTCSRSTRARSAVSCSTSPTPAPSAMSWTAASPRSDAST